MIRCKVLKVQYFVDCLLPREVGCVDEDRGDIGHSIYECGSLPAQEMNSSSSDPVYFIKINIRNDMIFTPECWLKLGENRDNLYKVHLEVSVDQYGRYITVK